MYGIYSSNPTKAQKKDIHFREYPPFYFSTQDAYASATTSFTDTNDLSFLLLWKVTTPSTSAYNV